MVLPQFSNSRIGVTTGMLRVQGSGLNTAM